MSDHAPTPDDDRAKMMTWEQSNAMLVELADRLDPDRLVELIIAGGAATTSAGLQARTADIDVVSDLPADVLFVMKLDAARPRDIDDLRVLWEHCTYATAEEAVADLRSEHRSHQLSLTLTWRTGFEASSAPGDPHSNQVLGRDRAELAGSGGNLASQNTW